MQLVTEKSAAGNGLRERKKRATRAALVEAALRLAAEHGAENVTVETVSEAAGVSPRTFFNYFDTRDDVFVMIDAESSARVRRAVREAPAALPPLDVLRDALAAELAEVEDRHELWALRAEVLHRSPHLLARSLGAHLADELELADALAERLEPAAPAGHPETVAGDGRRTAPEPCGTREPGAPASHGAGQRETPDPCSAREDGGPASDLYPRLLAAVGGTAVRVAVEHWCARRDRLAFADVFRRTFDLLAAGLAQPPGASPD
ncbi:TetR family transcriptional regulator [Streptomyces sp. t39]|uniref:TetR family transcriptional regulator n=1 Tax=Streptomyces sp. t39 TaxID=1828156 RepID=UPI0011CEAB5C|nr:TetR family transcriptional regulator [Streptomyces sp. t39]TXS58110.1 TetR family transcriptional regulator [Streptomyces sp. t39]